MSTEKVLSMKKEYSKPQAIVLGTASEKTRSQNETNADENLTLNSANPFNPPDPGNGS